MVLRSKSGLPVIMPASSDGRLIEGLYGSAVFAGERDVDGSARCTLPDPEVRLSRLTESHTRDVVLHDQPVVQRRQSFLVKALAPLKVRDGKTNVIQHRSTPRASETEATSGKLSIPHDALLPNSKLPRTPLHANFNFLEFPFHALG